MTDISPEIATLKATAKAGWMAGDYAKWSITLASGAQAFVDRLGIQPSMRVLDVACGDGNAAIPAARAGAIVTAVDIATPSLEAGRQRALKEDVQVVFDEGDAEQLAYADGEFDIVLSFFGAVFTPRPEIAGAELRRVCRPGGRIALSTWTAEGFMGQLFKLMGRYNPPAPNSPPPPAPWTDEATICARLGVPRTAAHITPRMCPFRYAFDVPEVVALFRRYNGPITRLFDRLDASLQMDLQQEMEGLFAQHNRPQQNHAGTTDIEAAYLEIIAVR